ncbi:MAG: hypothetical protein HY299_19500 [Verrucomicrobia bacterium]|nr:hypothetical protein [Verrucomicrobiota bacterium]
MNQHKNIAQAGSNDVVGVAYANVTVNVSLNGGTATTASRQDEHYSQAAAADVRFVYEGWHLMSELAASLDYAALDRKFTQLSERQPPTTRNSVADALEPPQPPNNPNT